MTGMWWLPDLPARRNSDCRVACGCDLQRRLPGGRAGVDTDGQLPTAGTSPNVPLRWGWPRVVPTSTKNSTMDRIEMPDEMNHHRRSLLGVAALGFAAARVRHDRFRACAIRRRGGAHDQGGCEHLVRLAETDRRRRPECRLCRSRPANGPAVILLHGWPYDIHSYVDVAPLLASTGYRVIVPYLRGYGTTRFLSGETIRNGQQAVIAIDIIALMDALKIEKAIIGGFDWGARTANIIAALWPERCKAMVSVSGYLIGSHEANKMPLPPKAELAMVVPVSIRDGTRPRRLREIPARFRQAHLAARVAEMGLRRRHVRSQRGGLRKSGPRRHRDPQLPLAARPGRRRAEI